MTSEDRTPRTLRGSSLAASAPWVAFAAAQALFAWRGLVRPSTAQIVVELAGLGLLAAAQQRLARGALTSLHAAGAVAVVMAAPWMAPTAPGKVAALGGALLLAWFTLRVSGSGTVVSGVVAAVLGVLVARGLVHLRLTSSEGNLSQAATADAAFQRLLDELASPLPATPTWSESDHPPIVLLTIDTLRWDSAQTMDTWRRLQDLGPTWPRAMSTSSWTLPAVASLMTGELPSVHGAGRMADGQVQGLAPEVTTLATTLAQNGYATSAIVANPWLAPVTGLDRGFETYVDVDAYAPHPLALTGMSWTGDHPHEGSVLVDRAVSWLEDAPADGWFLWVHLIDPHLPYRNTPGFETLTRPTLLTWPEAGRPAVRSAYEREVEAADAAAAQLLNALEARDFFAGGFLVMTSDHGEELWEHGGVEHGHSHHGIVVDVPLAVAGPGLSPGERHDDASLADVAPTLLHAAGLRESRPSLASSPSTGKITTAWGTLYGPPLASARQGNERVIVGNDEELRFRSSEYGIDEALPPAEDPLAAAARAIRGPASGEPVEREELRGLQALGYVE